MTFRTADTTQPEAALAVLELYLRAKEIAGPSGRFAMAGGLLCSRPLWASDYSASPRSGGGPSWRL